MKIWYIKKEKHILFELKITQNTKILYNYKSQPFEKACNCIKKKKIYGEYNNTHYLMGKISHISKLYAHNNQTKFRIYCVYVDIKPIKKENLEMMFPIIS